jgi:HEPN domain-containing protein
MSDERDPLTWIAKAEEDYAVARSAVRRKKPWTFTACFHAQQCAEKYIKGMLVAKGSQFSKVHDLLKLSQECERAGILITVDSKSLARLSLYASLTRYPGADPTFEDARDALEIAKTVRKFARKFLNVR